MHYSEATKYFGIAVEKKNTKPLLFVIVPYLIHSDLVFISK